MQSGRSGLLLVIYVSVCVSYVGGQEAESGRDAKPFSTLKAMVRVEADDADERPCGGTLVSKHIVLTAAQCVVGTSDVLRFPDVVLDAMSVHRSNRIPIKRRTLETVIYPAFSGVPGDGNDLALLRLDASLKAAENVGFRKEKLPLGANVTTIGAAAEAVRLRHATVVDPVICENAGMDVDEDTMICLTGDVPCTGDEGGPMLDPDTGKLIAVVSNTNDCKRGSHPLAVATLQAPYIMGWLESQLYSLESTAFLERGPPVIAFQGPDESASASAPGPDGEELEDVDAYLLLDNMG